MRGIIGFYNELRYFIVENKSGAILYIAGNSKLDSRPFLSAEDGVGLEKMKEFCEYTAREVAREKHIKYLGIEYDE